MRKIITLCLIIASHYLHANEEVQLRLKEVPITANPLMLSSDEMVNPIQIINGEDLMNLKNSSLGNTLKKIPGITNSSWGDSVGRPVIRGMDNNRIHLLNNGMEINDVSAMSGDHNVPIDTLSAEQIEVIRGPASIIYGGGATGGVINIIDTRIHPEFIEGLFGKYDVGYGGANNESSGSALIDYGVNNFMFHIDGYKRDSKNLKIPGYSVSKRLNQSEGLARNANGKDKLNNSYIESEGGSFGLTHVDDDGYLGFAISNHQNEYGNPIEDGAKFDMEIDRYDLAYESKTLFDFVDKFKFKFGYSDYEHQEIEPLGDIGSEFLKETFEGKFEFIHSWFNSPGVFGVDMGKHQFSKSQGDPFIANNHAKKISLYFLEEFNLLNQKFSVGFRQGYDRLDANSFISDDGCSVAYSSTTDCAASGGTELSTSFNKSKEEFHTSNITIGTTIPINSSWSWGINVNHTQRAPAYNELYAFGHHHATETIEQGNRNLEKEKSYGLDTQLKFKEQNFNFSFGPYYTRFEDYIALLNSGTTQNHLHEGEEDSEALPVHQYQNIPAEFYGFEVSSTLIFNDNYEAKFWSDYVRAKNRDGGNLPRIPPFRIGGSLSYEFNLLSTSFDVMHVFNQSDIESNELKTDGYTDLSFNIIYKLPIESKVSLYLKGTNLLDEEQRDHTSFLKDKTLMGERALTFGLSGTF